YLKGAIETVLTIHQAEDEGDILVFLTGEEEIEDTCRRIRIEAENLDSSKKDRPGPLMCVPLHSSLPLAQQQRVFDPPPPGGRKVVVSDNVAETGLTIGGIVSQMESLFVSPISQASAQQRAGRAGRTRPGKCFRLYTERDYGVELVGQTPPEILRLNLANTVLQLLKLGVANLAQFDYMDAPAPGMVTCALELLKVLSALDDDGNLTSLGGIMAEFPLEPQLAKVLIVSPEFRCSNELLSIVAMLSVPNVWLRPDNRRKEADAAKRVFTVPDSDHLTLMNVYNEYVNNKGDKKWCWNHYLSQSALQQAENVRQRLERSMERFDFDLVSQTDKRKLFTSIRQALVCGLFMQVVHRGAKDRYVIVKDDPVVSLHPSCGLDNTPEWVLFNEFVPTPRPYIRTVTNIQPEWLLEYAGMHYDLADFPESEAKRALQHVVQKKLGKVENGGRKVERKTKKAWR
ncbi:DEAH-box ATP-dependent RNA helicase prp43, partial [Ceratobasidium sp. UAMH 11750]